LAGAAALEKAGLKEGGHPARGFARERGRKERGASMAKAAESSPSVILPRRTRCLAQHKLTGSMPVPGPRSGRHVFFWPELSRLPRHVFWLICCRFLARAGPYIGKALMFFWLGHPVSRGRCAGPCAGGSMPVPGPRLGRHLCSFGRGILSPQAYVLARMLQDPCPCRALGRGGGRGREPGQVQGEGVHAHVQGGGAHTCVRQSGQRHGRER